ncbi:hypothetical protein [Aggregatibacter kilianii]|uniref:portal protein n=1 Tax=Aggregatibacter kilianii TaxID=2025884 RepID=UPI000D65819A|nr:hypothetical protein [Aggregatibacter kilianii]
MADNKEHIDDAALRAVAEDNWQRYVHARDLRHRNFIKRAQRNDRMYLGEQWTDADRQALERTGRPALTMNLILGTVNAAMGEMARSQADVQFKPARGANEQAAKDMNYVYQYVAQQNDLEKLELKVIMDGLILDRGYFDVRMDFTDNVLGDIKVTVEDPLDVIPDPTAKDEDPSSWAEVFITRWMTMDELEAIYGEKKARELRLQASGGLAADADCFEMRERTYGGEQMSSEFTGTLAEKDIKRVRVVERQYYKTRRVLQFVDAQTGDVRDVTEKMAADREKLALLVSTQPTVTLREITKRAVRTTITAGYVVLYDDWSLYDTFTIIPYFPYFRRGNPLGMVTNLVGPQELYNKVSSQELHIVNTTANSGWIIEENSLVNMDADELAEQGSKTGTVLEYKKGFNAPAKITPNMIPPGIHNISQKAVSSVRTISGVNESIMGTDRADVSGVAITQRREAGQAQLTMPVKNINSTRKMLARKVLELAQKFFTETRTFFITDYSQAGHPQTEHSVNVPDETGQIPADLTRGKYDIVIGMQPSRDSVDETIFSEAISMRSAGVAIPDHIIIQHSNLPKRYEIAEMVAKAQGFGELSPEEQQMAAAQMQQQIAAAAQALEKTEAEIEELKARAALQAAKADTLDGYSEHAIRLSELQTKRDMAADMLKTRVALAQLATARSESVSQRSAATKIASDMLKLGGNYER